jgi:hypothetical protein
VLTRWHACVAHGRTPAGPQARAQDVRLASRLARVPFLFGRYAALIALDGECRASAAHTGGGCNESERRASPFVTGEGRERVSRLPATEIYHGKFSSQARAQPFA